MINSIYKLFLDELKFFQESSHFTSQSMKNQDECGELIELAIRKFLREVVGERFKITHGYIYSSRNKKLSPQIDIIITDKLVTHCLKKFEHLDNLEIVPVEAVVAVFEVKRTLRAGTLKKAADHLNNIFESVPLSKERNDRYLPGGAQIISGAGISIGGGNYSNPMIGIIGLLHEKNNYWDKLPWFVDAVFSFQGVLRAPKDPNGESLKVYSHRYPNDDIKYKEFIEDANEQGQIKILKGFVAYILQYLNEVTGRIPNMNEYFS